MDPELRYGRAYVPRSNYSYITTTNLPRKRASTPTTRAYSMPPPTERDWTPSTTWWMPKREWYYGAYEDLYAPSSSLKARLKSGDSNVSRRRMMDDIHYELNRFRPPHLESRAEYPVRRYRDHNADNWQDTMDLLFPSTTNRSFRNDAVQNNYSGTRLSRRSAHNKERLNDLRYDYDILRRGRMNDYPGLPRYGYVPFTSSEATSIYDDVGPYLHPSSRPSPTLKPLRGVPAYRPYEEWLPTTSHSFSVPARYLVRPEPYRAKSVPRSRFYGGHRAKTPDYFPTYGGRGKSASPPRRSTYVPSYTPSTYTPSSYSPSSTYESPARPSRRAQTVEPSSDYTPSRPRKVTYDVEPVPDRPRAKARDVSPPTERPSRSSRPKDDDEAPRPTRATRFAPTEEEPNLEKRRIPSVSADQPVDRAVPNIDAQEPAAKAPKPSVTEEPEAEAAPEAEKATPAEEEAAPDVQPQPEPEAEQPAQEEPAKEATPQAPPQATPRASVSKTPQETPRESVSQTPTETPRASVAEEPKTPSKRSSLAGSRAASVKASVAETPRESVAEEPSTPTNVGKNKDGLGWSTPKSPKPSVTDQREEKEPSPAPTEEEVFEEQPAAEEAPTEEEAAPAEEEEPQAEPEEEAAPEEEAPAEEEQQPEEEEEVPAQKKVARQTSENFEFGEDTEQQQNGVEEENIESVEVNGDEEHRTTVTKRTVGGTTTTTTKTTTTTTTYEEEEGDEVVEYEEVIEGNGHDDQPSQLEYGDEEDLNVQSMREKSGYSRGDSVDQVEDVEENEEEETL
ncbi:hypothetical protein RvY_17880-2 [Ramazzottius varieornatus]|uniref:Uncharacterized protein n=1 Tax=Ramazzottius varieornatus TaxID=947166 RepID=A0A1D1W4E1_RAMVA|nr:hypothetical protein RvY_17880-2 [Ramazzottius varieornatus]